MVKRFLMTLMGLVLLLSGCNGFKAWFAKEFKQAEVSSGIARLSAQHLSIITSEISKKFKDDTVKQKVDVEEDQDNYGKGKVVKTIENINIAYTNDQVVFTDCLGNVATWDGKIRVIKASQTMYGHLTKNPGNPVIPEGNQVSMKIHAQAENLRIKFSNKDSHIEIQDGEIIFDAYPRLAQAQKGNLKGLRVIPTSNSRFERVMLRNVSVMLFSEKVTMPFDIAESSYTVQIGVGENGDENRLIGRMTAFGIERPIPNDGEILVPDYNAQEFVSTYSCKDELAGVVLYQEVALEEKLGPSMAALTMLTMSKIAGKFADDSTCGMASPGFMNRVNIQAQNGDQGYAEGELDQPCQINFTNYRTEPDCMGIAYEISGDALITAGKRSTRGFVLMQQADFANAVVTYGNLLINDLARAVAEKPEPIIPTYMQPAVISITADISKITLKEVCIDQGSRNHAGHCTANKDFAPVEFDLKGKAQAVLKPVMGKGIDQNDRVYGMCAVRNLPIAEAELSVQDVSAVIKKSGNQLAMKAQGAYRAVSGRIADKENELSGDITIGKVKVPFIDKANNKNFVPLKPDYDRQKFEDSYLSCNQGKFVVPQSDADCSI